MLKIAILAEKFATDFKWYVDIILNLIRLAGDYVSEEVWYRIIQIIINKQEVQGYAAKTCFEVTTSSGLPVHVNCTHLRCYVYTHIPGTVYTVCAVLQCMGHFISALFTAVCVQALQAPACHENMVKVGGYILGEFGNLIAGDSRSR